MRRQAAIARFLELMRRHVMADDLDKPDDAFVRAVLERYERERGRPIIDPNE